MPRSVFFSFHYQKDIWRVSQVRNSWVTKGKANTFIDAASWESIRRRGTSAVKGWIDRQLVGTSVTVVLIGQETASRKYVQYEIQESLNRGNGLLGIYIHRIKDRIGNTSDKGRNPLDDISKEEEWFFGLKYERRLSDIFPTYDWVGDDGYENMAAWVEEAAQKSKK